MCSLFFFVTLEPRVESYKKFMGLKYEPSSAFATEAARTHDQV